MRNKQAIGLFCAAATVALTACSGSMDSPADGSVLGTTQETLTGINGDHLGGISDADFQTAKTNFAQVETSADGVGPIFNDTSCGNCHSVGAVGGMGLQIERRFGKFVNGAFDPETSKGGSLRQLKSLGAWKSGCSVPMESEPSDATVHNVGRLTTPLFGLGLVDALPDSAFVNQAASEPADIRGIANMVSVLLPTPGDSTQSVGSTRVGRFGWKAGVPNLVQFSADAYVNEMGITTQHCINGTSVMSFAGESAPNGTAVSRTCEDGKPGVDDAAGSCSLILGTNFCSCPSGQTIIQDDVANFNKFMTFLAPAVGPGINSVDTAAGAILFETVGCSGCHKSGQFTTPSSPANGVPGNVSFRPYSDFLLHDMGTFGDHIGNSGDSVAVTQRMRTAPLWGIFYRVLYMHDGSASTVADAIVAHSAPGSQSLKSYNNYTGLSATGKRQLIAFVSNL